MAILLQFLTGLIFGLGLIVAGMADPAKVLNFLDLTGTWDPSLAFVMAGAIAVTFFGFRLALRRPQPILAKRFHLPTASGVDARVVVGPAIFGIGWGLSGLCPGPALTLLGFGLPSAFIFVAAMAAGMAIARWRDGRQAADVSGPQRAPHQT
ncbi:DUF6691 family protein [Chelatococcus asaccharovorans]|uniref:Sulphur transport domain-containing protein n=1 Tax=Chelatococcus asaccharovorans TaxID=28210 RepID=A0A2V3URH2_9HYPH|nr:DUF6691 family protein [Chelatococcus asaccharovorans]MBS7707127.1 YeeE/YedE family protein [Chelatococcus asaccharovorans]PXW63309.1 hypothetical protein C7450_102224 [Chelatococcus asaccharovorans]